MDDKEQEHYGWFGVPPRPVVNPEEMEAAMAIRSEGDMGHSEFEHQLHEGRWI